jgi:hypothetical protein
VQQGSLVMFRHMVQQLLNIEQFCKKNSTKSTLNIFKKLGQSLDITKKHLLIKISWR